MLINVNVLPTHYQIEKTEKIEGFDELSQRDRRSKRIGRREKYFKTKCVRRWRHRSGYSSYLAQLAVSVGRLGSVFHRRIQTIGKLLLTTTNVLPSTPAIFSLNWLTNEHSFSNNLKEFRTKLHQNRWTNKLNKDAEESENRLKHKNEKM